MSRKDSEKDSERPHYYSQFWLDIAAGRRVIGTPKPTDEAEPTENEAPEPVSPRRASRIQDDHVHANADGRSEKIVHPVAEPIAAAEEFFEPDDEVDQDLTDADELSLQNLDEADIPDMDLGPVEDGEEEFFEDEAEAEPEEEEEEMGWGGRGRKKARPTRPVKPVKKPKRDTRRGY